MAFKLKPSRGSCPDDPEALLRDLRRRTIPGPLAHQADVIRSYMKKHQEDADVALQLPTGSGKTLVGLLIAEWRRRKYNERAVYLCPTKQLVYQVAEHAQDKYGLDVQPFVGRKADYDKKAAADWQEGDILGITTYSSLFNTRPFFENPHLIVLDDAHSAENYIADCWSLNVERRSHTITYDALARVLAPLLPASDAARLLEDSSEDDGRWVDLIPGPKFASHLNELSPLLDAHTKDTDLWFPWTFIRDSLEACLCYVSSRAILIRPLIPPSDHHEPFAKATQRIYMSATLGEGGDLERITGRHPIHRVPVPPGWDKQGIGRRFFVFPQRSLEPELADSFAGDAIRLFGRALYLVPDERRAEIVRQWATDDLRFQVFNAREIEESKKRFASTAGAVAVVANRYDGIDLVNDECRLLLAEGLPKGANLQERFLVSRVGASLSLDDRILTRVVQGFGRCTRSPNDHATVLIYGEDLQKYLLAAERREFFHPEIQAELIFGLNQSKEVTGEEMLENLQHFLNQDAQWEKADAEIVSDRTGRSQKRLPATEDLGKVVVHELAYQYAAWRGDYVAALAACKTVLGELTDPDLRGYRALWLYLAGCAAHLAHQHGQSHDHGQAREYFRQASDAAPGLRWLISLHRAVVEHADGNTLGASDGGAEALVERIEFMFDRLGTVHDRKFSEREAEIRRLIERNDGKTFERGHMLLGELLGYDAGNAETDGAPDPWWNVDGSLCLVFEDYTEATEETDMPVKKARQVAGHPAWVRHQLSLDDDAEIVPILLTAATRVKAGAVPHLQNVRYWILSEFNSWANKALRTIRELRQSYPGEGNLNWRAEAAERLRNEKIAPRQLLEMLQETAAGAMQEVP